MTEKKILIFGGTTEGRKLTEYLAARKVRVHVCVATAYGESLLPESESVTAESSRMDVSEMCHRIRSMSRPSLWTPRIHMQGKFLAI